MAIEDYVDFRKVGAGAAYNGTTLANSNARLQQLITNVGNGKADKNSKKFYDDLVKAGSNTGAGLDANQQSALKSALSSGKLSADFDPNISFRALDYSVREQARSNKRSKEGGILDSVLKYVGPVVGALTGQFYLGALAGAVGGGISGGFKGALLGAASGAAAGYFSPGIGSLSNAPLSSVNGYFPADIGARATTSASLLAKSGSGTILNGLSNIASSPAAKVAKAASTGNSVQSTGDNIATLVKGAASVAPLAALAFARGGGGTAATGLGNGVQGAAPVSLDSVGALTQEATTVRGARESEKRRIVAALGTADTVKTSAQGVLEPAKTKRKTLLGA